MCDYFFVGLLQKHFRVPQISGGKLIKVTNKVYGLIQEKQIKHSSC